jgi:hypothetical protein
VAVAWFVIFMTADATRMSRSDVTHLLLPAAPFRYYKLLMTVLVSAATLAAALLVGLSPRRAVSLPLYARQTGQPCATCHTAFWELTPFGRRFKLGGYTLGGGDWSGPPFAVTLQPGYTHTEAGQPGGAAPHFGANNNITVQATSLYTGGRITDNLGAFIQGTYDSVSRRFGWDQADIRYADKVDVAGRDLLWGVTLNNNPTVQDVWNTLPAWRFPYVFSGLMPQPAATPFIAGPFAQRVLGLGAYGFLDDLLYFELSGYRPLSTNTQLVLGTDTTGFSPPYSPRWRVPSEPPRWRDDGVSRRGVCFAAGWGLWGRRWRFSGRVYRGDLSPVVYGPVGISAAAMWRIKVASGQATAKASRTRDALSITRAPSFKRRRRRVANSAAASACAFGMTSRTVSISPSRPRCVGSGASGWRADCGSWCGRKRAAPCAI